jgi:hypothetical protein
MKILEQSWERCGRDRLARGTVVDLTFTTQRLTEWPVWVISDEGSTAGRAPNGEMI